METQDTIVRKVSRKKRDYAFRKISGEVRESIADRFDTISEEKGWSKKEALERILQDYFERHDQGEQK